MYSDTSDLEVELPRSTTGPAAARRALASWCEGRADPDVIADAELLVSELASNAVVHGQGAVVLRARLERDRLRIELVDQGSGFARQVHRDGPPRVGGWGLEFVDRLSDRWGVRDGSTHVWFELGCRQRDER